MTKKTTKRSARRKPAAKTVRAPLWGVWIVHLKRWWVVMGSNVVDGIPMATTDRGRARMVAGDSPGYVVRRIGWAEVPRG